MLTIGEALGMVQTVAYTDGSQAPEGLVGAGVVMDNMSWHGTLNDDSTVFDGELAAREAVLGYL